MKIVFVTTMSATGSTVIGRVLPLAHKLSQWHEIAVLLHDPTPIHQNHISYRSIGQDPFVKTTSGKQRLTGLALVWRMIVNTFNATRVLFSLEPDVIIIVKSLPQNVLATWLYQKTQFMRSKSRPLGIILDVDDFELTANALTNLTQRAAVHWAERTGAQMADHIVTATPFLSDHFKQLTGHTRKISLIPTGLTINSHLLKHSDRPSLLYIGSVSRSSGHRIDLLPSILRQVKMQYPHATLTIAGSGDDIQSLKLALAQADLTQSVTWFGRFSMSDIPNILTNINTIIDPIDDSISNRAKSSFRVNLAAGYGYPLVTSNIGIRPYLLPQHLHNQFFARPADPFHYAQKISNLLANPLKKNDQQTMISHAKQYNWQKLAAQYQALL